MESRSLLLLLCTAACFSTLQGGTDSEVVMHILCRKKITVKIFVKSIDNCLKKAVSMPIVQWSKCCAGTKIISYTIFFFFFFFFTFALFGHY